ncbi:MAG: hypothetical protein ACRDSR_06085 [Pseudonocardiaceae bacterium]
MIAEVTAMMAAEPPAATPIPAPQFGNSPDSGRPPVEQFPRPMSTPARALHEYFLANADRGDHAANDELVAEMLRRIRALRASHEDGC